jgi:biopolymer transport protein ExbD
MAVGSGSGSRGLKVDMNVTPLIDVLLVLLITFMVIVPVPSKGLGTQVPQPSGDQSHDTGTEVVVQILKGQSGQVSYRINQDDLPLTELELRLRAILSVRANRSMFIRGDAGLDFSTVAQVLDIAKGAGADNIGLLTPKNAI